MPATLTLTEPFVEAVRREATAAGFDSEQALLEDALAARRERVEAEAERREILAAVAESRAQFARGEGIPFEQFVRGDAGGVRIRPRRLRMFPWRTRVKLSTRSRADLRRLLAYRTRVSANADEWFARLTEAITGIGRMPESHAIALEQPDDPSVPVLRELIFGRRTDKVRVLFDFDGTTV